MKNKPWHEPVEVETRKAWPKATTIAVWRRCEGKCSVPGCGSKEGLQMDHITPRALGGSSEPDNVELLCIVHHKEKTAQRDMPAISKAVRLSKKQSGEKPRFVKAIQSAGFKKGQSRPLQGRPWPKKEKR